MKKTIKDWSSPVPPIFKHETIENARRHTYTTRPLEIQVLECLFMSQLGMAAYVAENKAYIVMVNNGQQQW
jgi:hypothetical protein